MASENVLDWLANAIRDIHPSLNSISQAESDFEKKRALIETMAELQAILKLCQQAQAKWVEQNQALENIQAQRIDHSWKQVEFDEQRKMIASLEAKTTAQGAVLKAMKEDRANMYLQHEKDRAFLRQLMSNPTIFAPVLPRPVSQETASSPTADAFAIAAELQRQNAQRIEDETHWNIMDNIISKRPASRETYREPTGLDAGPKRRRRSQSPNIMGDTMRRVTRLFGTASHPPLSGGGTIQRMAGKVRGSSKHGSTETLPPSRGGSSKDPGIPSGTSTNSNNGLRIYVGKTADAYAELSVLDNQVGKRGGKSFAASINDMSDDERKIIINAEKEGASQCLFTKLIRKTGLKDMTWKNPGQACDACSRDKTKPQQCATFITPFWILLRNPTADDEIKQNVIHGQHGIVFPHGPAGETHQDETVTSVQEDAPEVMENLLSGATVQEDRGQDEPILSEMFNQKLMRKQAITKAISDGPRTLEEASRIPLLEEFRQRLLELMSTHEIFRNDLKHAPWSKVFDTIVPLMESPLTELNAHCLACQLAHIYKKENIVFMTTDRTTGERYIQRWPFDMWDLDRIAADDKAGSPQKRTRVESRELERIIERSSIYSTHMTSRIGLLSTQTEGSGLSPMRPPQPLPPPSFAIPNLNEETAVQTEATSQSFFPSVDDVEIDTFLDNPPRRFDMIDPRRHPRQFEFIHGLYNVLDSTKIKWLAIDKILENMNMFRETTYSQDEMTKYFKLSMFHSKENNLRPFRIAMDKKRNEVVACLNPECSSAQIHRIGQTHDTPVQFRPFNDLDCCYYILELGARSRFFGTLSKPYEPTLEEITDCLNRFQGHDLPKSKYTLENVTVMIETLISLRLLALSGNDRVISLTGNDSLLNYSASPKRCKTFQDVLWDILYSDEFYNPLYLAPLTAEVNSKLNLGGGEHFTLFEAADILRKLTRRKFVMSGTEKIDVYHYEAGTETSEQEASKVVTSTMGEIPRPPRASSTQPAIETTTTKSAPSTRVGRTGIKDSEYSRVFELIRIILLANERRPETPWDKNADRIIWKDAYEMFHSQVDEDGTELTFTKATRILEMLQEKRGFYVTMDKDYIYRKPPATSEFSWSEAQKARARLLHEAVCRDHEPHETFLDPCEHVGWINEFLAHYEMPDPKFTFLEFLLSLTILVEQKHFSLDEKYMYVMERKVDQ